MCGIFGKIQALQRLARNNWKTTPRKKTFHLKLELEVKNAKTRNRQFLLFYIVQKVDSTTHYRKFLRVIRWIVIYLVDSAIHLLNNPRQFNKFFLPERDMHVLLMPVRVNCFERLISDKMDPHQGDTELHPTTLNYLDCEDHRCVPPPPTQPLP